MIRIYQGDCLARLRELPDASVDSVVTDPPYGLSFMGKQWDYDVPPVEVWQECLRVLKPGGHLLAFAGTRTQHRMAVRIEDAGFEIRDMIAWVYGSGFPKSKNLGDGIGSALKPALEPITLARKPCEGTLEKNHVTHGTGGLNIDGCRIPVDGEIIHAPLGDPSKRAGVVGSDLGISRADKEAFQAAQRASVEKTMTLGRWPANLIHDGSDEVLALFPESKGQQGDVRGTEPSQTGGEGTNCYGEYGRVPAAKRSDFGSAARFFYCSKASKAERGAGNGHPTVKPVDLMRYLCRLVTPPGGTVLDPYLGSGTTALACLREGFACIGMEMNPDYVAIACARIEADAPLLTSVVVE